MAECLDEWNGWKAGGMRGLKGWRSDMTGSSTSQFQKLIVVHPICPIVSRFIDL